MNRRVLIDGAGTALRVWWGVAAAVLLSFVAAMPAHAGYCPKTSCTLRLSENNGFTTGTYFGTVSLNLNTITDTVTIDVSLTSAYRIIDTGFPGAFGFSDSLGGGLTIGNFKTGGVATTLYSCDKTVKKVTIPNSCPSDATNDLHFDGFGYANNAAAITGPKRADSLQEVSFTVSKGTSLTNVNQLLHLFSGASGEGPTYFVVDACNWVAATCKGTGLLGSNGTAPEPGSLVLLGTGLLALGIWRRRKLI